MNLLGIDPGATTGWCEYSSHSRTVVSSGMFPASQLDVPGHVFHRCGAVIVERPVAQGATRPQVVDCAYTSGILVGRLREQLGADRVHEMTRLDVRRTLQELVHGTVRVKDDRSVWAALVVIHGEGSDQRPRTRKGEEIDPGGAIGRVRSHERAALAVAVAWLARCNLESKA